MKLLFVINTMGQAGAEMALLELLRRISENGHNNEYEISLYVMLGQGELIHQVPECVKLLNTRYHACPVLSGKGRLALANTILRSFFHNGNIIRKTKNIVVNLAYMIRRHQIQIDKLCWRLISDGGEFPKEHYDLAVAYLEGASTYFVADHVNAKKKAAFIHIDYSSAGYTRRMDGDCYQAFDRIFAVSDEVKEKFLQMYPEHAKRMGVFHNIVNQDRIRRLAKEGQGFSDKFNGYRLLTVGRLTHQKAYDVAIPALAHVRAAGKNVRWYVLGEGPKRAALERQIAASGLENDFLLLGAVENPYPYYRQCDLYVHATRFEGKSIAIQEAQTLGCTILASDCTGNREQIEDGIDGRFCILTPEGIAEGILKLLEDSDERKRLGQAAAGKNLSEEGELWQLLELLG